MLDVRRLWILCEVARCGSFTAAAQALAYTPAAISQQIAVLEREVGVQLVQRGARGVSLTEPGRILVTEAEPVFRKLTSIEEQLRDFGTLKTGVLRLGWFATAGSTLVSRAIAAFRAKYPGIDLDLFQGDPEECVPRLQTGEINMALVYQFPLEPPLPDSVEQIDLMDDPLHIGLPARHRLSAHDRLDLADLAGEDWIQGVTHGPTLDVLPQACRAVGFVPLVVMRTNDRTVVEGLVAAGVGVALMPQITVPDVRPDIAIRNLHSDTLRRKVRIALPAKRYRSPATEAMIGVIKEICAQVDAEATARLSRPALP